MAAAEIAEELSYSVDALVLARESRGLTQTELAKRTGFSQAAISKVEHRLITPTPELVRKIAVELRYPESFFLGSRIVRRDLPATFYRKRASLGPPAIRRIAAQMDVRRRHLTELLRAAETPEARVPMVELGGDVRSPVQAAVEVRASWRVPRGPIENLTKLLEDNGVVVLQCDFGSSKIDGLSICDLRDGLPPTVFMSSSLSGERYRFTLAHELAHIVLHHHLVLPPEECEDEANDFASEFLMPSQDIRGFFGRVTLESLFQMKPHWKVSAAALVRRARTLNRITESQYRYLMIRLNQYRHEEPVPIPREVPSLVNELIEAHTRELGYSDEDLSEALGLLIDEFRELYAPVRAGGLRLVR